ncbi:hypothetical protein AQUCO_02000457v1 [Aquilegia coerulea]|uniref:SWIRM domain-containing protein n=1 Tax=Aquilegia coerulea TaxID=218851 RepID=A0A2G5DHN5_AQUCA|nr:hypothetical protein AQUCO_02000457v1 [Aquilegia coerulea]
MEKKTSPIKEPITPLSQNQTKSLEIASNPTNETAVRIDSPSQESSPLVSNLITIPSCSRWFSWDKVHESERRSLPEFFDERSPSKNPRVYMYYRNSIINMFREKPSRKITFTQVRKVLIGDVGSIRRVFDFLEGWGLINYTGTTSKTASKLDDKENRLGSDFKGSSHDTSTLKKDASTRFCSGCKTVCSIACFVCDKFDLTLCARCYVRGNYRVGVATSDFRRVEISEQTKTEWTDKETLQLLEAIMHYGDDWKKVAEHVGGRSESECVARFIKLPFKEQFIGHPDSENINKYNGTISPGDVQIGEEDSFLSSPAKKRRLTPFSDTSNPIMAQVAFLSAMAGSGVAEAAARAAVEALSESNLTSDQRCVDISDLFLPDEIDQNGMCRKLGTYINTGMEFRWTTQPYTHLISLFTL